MLMKSTSIQLQKSERKLVSTKWRYRACVNELLEEEETAEDGKELINGQYDRDEQQETKGFDMAGNTWHCQQERVINDAVPMWTRAGV